MNQRRRIGVAVALFSVAVCAYMGMLSIRTVSAETGAEIQKTSDLTESVSLSNWKISGNKNELHIAQLSFDGGLLSEFNIDGDAIAEYKYGYLMDYITFNGVTVREISEETDLDGYVFSTFPSNSNPKYKLPILLFQNANDKNCLDIMVHNKYFENVQGQIEITVLEGFYLEKDGTRYEVNEDVVYYLAEDIWLRDTEISEKIMVSGWSAVGQDGERMETTVGLGKDALKGMDVGYGATENGAYGYLAEYITVNGKTVADINYETDVSDYSFPENTSDEYRLPILVKQVGDTFKVKIHNRYVQSLGMNAEVTVGVKAGLRLENPFVGRAYTLGSDFSVCVYQVPSYTLTVRDGDSTSIFELKAGENIALETPFKEHYDFLGWADENGEEILAQMPASDYEVHSRYEAKTYFVHFLDEAGKRIVASVPYTIEEESIEMPAVPEKAGYTGEWQSYALDGGDKRVLPIYTLIPVVPEEPDDSTGDEPDEPNGTPDSITGDEPNEPNETPDSSTGDEPDKPNETPDSSTGDEPDKPNETPDDNTGDEPDKPNETPEDNDGNESSSDVQSSVGENEKEEASSKQEPDFSSNASEKNGQGCGGIAEGGAVLAILTAGFALIGRKGRKKE